MTDSPEAEAHRDPLEVLAEEVAGVHGRPVVVDLGGEDVWKLVLRLHALRGHDFNSEIRMVLGSACTTAARAVEQFVTALELPYAASQGWTDFFDQLGERGVGARQYLVVADASSLLKYEDYERWKELVERICGGPYCLGGGWTTLVLADAAYRWDDWMFRATVEAAPPHRRTLLSLRDGTRIGP
ncbi:hypothetical protein ACQP1W_27835 [Spirillospora sp. CA-255316]